MRIPIGRLSHAYIVETMSADQRNEFSLRLAAAMLCRGEGEKPCTLCRDCRKALAGIHPDISRIGLEKDDKGSLRREIYVAQIRAVIADSAVLPNEAECRVFIIDDADCMNESAQNALLKLLEEPPAHVRFILCASNAGALLDTVRSRCIEISGSAPAQALPSEASDAAGEYFRLLAGNDMPELLLLCSSWEKLSPAQAGELFAAGETAAADILCMRADSMGMPRSRIYEALELFHKASVYCSMNVGVKHILGMLSAHWSA